MWTGYIRIKKSTDIDVADITAIKAIGSGQTPNYPNLCTHVRVSLDDREAIIELQSTIEPVQGDIPFGVTEFQVFVGACWNDRCTTTGTYIKDNIAEWE